MSSYKKGKGRKPPKSNIGLPNLATLTDEERKEMYYKNFEEISALRQGVYAKLGISPANTFLPVGVRPSSAARSSQPPQKQHQQRPQHQVPPRNGTTTSKPHASTQQQASSKNGTTMSKPHASIQQRASSKNGTTMSKPHASIQQEVPPKYGTMMSKPSAQSQHQVPLKNGTGAMITKPLVPTQQHQYSLQHQQQRPVLPKPQAHTQKEDKLHQNIRGENQASASKTETQNIRGGNQPSSSAAKAETELQCTWAKDLAENKNLYNRPTFSGTNGLPLSDGCSKATPSTSLGASAAYVESDSDFSSFSSEEEYDSKDEFEQF